jgi:TorA maturation chaperone TorD
MTSKTAKVAEQILEEDLLRADMYGFLAALLRKEPEDSLIAQVSGLEGDDSPIGAACATLAKLARSLDGGIIRNEYVELFVGVGRGEILPFASYYLTGFLNDRPLANLRNDMTSIGIKRAEGVKEPEDHIASLFAMMAGLIRGDYGRTFSVAEQGTFFAKHIQPWGDLLMRDVEAAKTAVFFAPLGTMGRAFLEIESQAFAMGLADHD